MVGYSGAVSKIPGKNPAGNPGHRLFSRLLVPVLHQLVIMFIHISVKECEYNSAACAHMKKQ
jgi:hypothetical protein